MNVYGYVRVSTKEQNPTRQLLALSNMGIADKNLYMDQMSGKDFCRPQYKKMIKKLKAGDTVVIKSIDRLGRNYGEILKQWRLITKEIGADIQVIDMPLLNTASESGDLTGVFISDLVLQILAYVAETERSFIKQRQAEGIRAAKLNGVKFGCPRVELPENFGQYYEWWKEGKISSRQAADTLQMSHSTFYRRCREWQEEKGRKCCK